MSLLLDLTEEFDIFFDIFFQTRYKYLDNSEVWNVHCLLNNYIQRTFGWVKGSVLSCNFFTVNWMAETRHGNCLCENYMLMLTETLV